MVRKGHFAIRNRDPPTRSTFLPIPMHYARFSPIQVRIAAWEQPLEAERTAHEATRNTVKLTTLQIEKLKVSYFAYSVSATRAP